MNTYSSLTICVSLFTLIGCSSNELQKQTKDSTQPAEAVSQLSATVDSIYLSEREIKEVYFSVLGREPGPEELTRILALENLSSAELKARLTHHYLNSPEAPGVAERWRRVVMRAFLWTYGRNVLAAEAANWAAQTPRIFSDLHAALKLRLATPEGVQEASDIVVRAFQARWGRDPGEGALATWLIRRFDFQEMCTALDELFARSFSKQAAPMGLFLNRFEEVTSADDRAPYIDRAASLRPALVRTNLSVVRTIRKVRETRPTITPEQFALLPQSAIETALDFQNRNLSVEAVVQAIGVDFDDPEAARATFVDASNRCNGYSNPLRLSQANIERYLEKISLILERFAEAGKTLEILQLGNELQDACVNGDMDPNLGRGVAQPLRWGNLGMSPAYMREVRRLVRSYGQLVFATKALVATKSPSTKIVSFGVSDCENRHPEHGCIWTADLAAAANELPDTENFLKVVDGVASHSYILESEGEQGIDHAIEHARQIGLAFGGKIPLYIDELGISKGPDATGAAWSLYARNKCSAV